MADFRERLDSDDQAELAVFSDPDRLESGILREWAQQHHITVRDKSESGIVRALLHTGAESLREKALEAGYAELAEDQADGLGEQRTRRNRYVECVDQAYGEWRLCFAGDLLVRHGARRKPWVVVSNNVRNRNLNTVLAARATTTPKLGVPTAVPLGAAGPLVGSILADDLIQLFDDEIATSRPAGALSPGTVVELNKALAIALGLP